MASDKDSLLQLFDSVKAKYGTLLTDFKADDDYIAGDYGSDILPDDWSDEGLGEAIILTTISDAIDNAADHILTFPKIDVPVRPVEEGVENATATADERRQFLEMFWDRAFTENRDPLGEGKRSLVKGKLVLKKEINWDLIPDAPTSRSQRVRDTYRRKVANATKSEFLWNLRVVPKETVFEDLANPHDPSFVFENFRITVTEAMRRFPEMKGRLEDRDPMEEVDYIEYWSKPKGSDRGEYVQWIEEEEVYRAINPYSWESPRSTKAKPDYIGYVPYCIGDPGWGEVKADNNPYDRYISLTRPIRRLAKAETRMMTAYDAALRFHVFKPILAKNMGELEDGEKSLKFGPGQVWHLSEDQEMAPFDMGELPLSIMQGMSKIQHETDRHSKFGALGGTPQRGVDTATEADQNSRNAATKLAGPVRTLRRMVMKINTWVLQDVEKVLGVPVTLYGALDAGPSEITLNPSDIKGFYFTNVQLETSDEAALNLSNARTWADLTQRWKISDRTGMKMAGIPNPSAQIDEWMIEQIETSDQAQQIMTLMMMSGFQGLDAMEVVKRAMLESMSGGQQGESGSDTQPDVPQPVSPVDQFRAQAGADANQQRPDRAYR
jgi:hypothetical protein